MVAERNSANANSRPNSNLAETNTLTLEKVEVMGKEKSVTRDRSESAVTLAN